MEDQVLRTHRPNGPLAHEEPLEVSPNVDRAFPVVVDRESAVLCLAQPQSHNPFPSFLFHPLPSSTFAQALALHDTCDFKVPILLFTLWTPVHACLARLGSTCF